MSDIAEFLIKNYYSKFPDLKRELVPSVEQIERGYQVHPDKFVIVRDDKIRGVACFLRLSDETFEKLGSMDIGRVDILSILLEEFGPNLHFVLLCADGYKTIITGINRVKRKYNPKTISWWNPDITKLHKYKVEA